MDPLGHECDDARLLRILRGLLAQDVATLDEAMRRAADALAAILAADKVDVFLHDPAGDILVSIGTSDTPMGQLQRALGLHRLPLADGGRAAEVFRSGEGRLTHRAEDDPLERRDIVVQLGVRATVAVPLALGGERRGVLLVASGTPESFAEHHLHFTEVVAGWIGLVGYRLAHLEQLAARVAHEDARRAAKRAVAILTRRQREVAALIAAGLTNAEIARRLVLTPGTVANHVEHILRRLKLQGRTQIATWAMQHALYRPGGDARVEEG